MNTLVKDNRRKFSDNTEAEIVSRYIGGERTGLLAEEFKCDKKTILEMAKRHGHAEYASMQKGGVRGVNTKELNPKIIELHSQGLSQQAIGKGVGVSQNVISRVLRQNGLNANNPCKDQRGDKNNSWKGGKTIRTDGYVLVSNNSFPTMVNKMGYVLEHRLNMAKYLNRPLEVWETVHHIDGNVENNDVSNLQLRIGKHGKHIVYACADCGSENIYPTKIKNMEPEIEKEEEMGEPIYVEMTAGLAGKSTVN